MKAGSVAGLFPQATPLPAPVAAPAAMPTVVVEKTTVGADKVSRFQVVVAEQARCTVGWTRYSSVEKLCAALRSKHGGLPAAVAVPKCECCLGAQKLHAASAARSERSAGPRHRCVSPLSPHRYYFKTTDPAKLESRRADIQRFFDALLGWAGAPARALQVAPAPARPRPPPDCVLVPR